MAVLLEMMLQVPFSRHSRSQRELEQEGVFPWGLSVFKERVI